MELPKHAPDRTEHAVDAFVFRSRRTDHRHSAGVGDDGNCSRGPSSAVGPAGVRDVSAGT